ncbi:hypothetical protein [Streptomyces sp. NRRL S-118]|uniref:hypothetical protein n=1 Tax=Streptomyces sp. NRRL S-118 TaxID=1463881 RepID=UPI000693B5C7|nr:hypothetical protein [Streptomyces sp. NRRL S-118]
MRRAGDKGRAVFLCGILVAVGSPWARELLLEWWPHEGVLLLLHRALFVPQWSTPVTSDDLTHVVTWRNYTALAGLLLGVLALVPRLVGRAPTPGIRWVAALGTGFLISLLSTVLSWAVIATSGPEVLIAFGGDASAVLVNFTVDGLLFGLPLGLLIAVVYARAGTAAPRCRRRTPTRTRERSTPMGTSTPDAPVAVATGTVPGDVTRYLCAAAYTDPVFVRRVVEGVLGDGLGAIAVSPGVDLVPVARHSLTARRLRRRRDRRLAAAYGLIALFGPLWLLFAPLALRVLGGAAAPRAKRRPVRGRDLPRTSEAVWRLAGAATALLLAGAAAGMALSALPLPGLLRWLTGGYLLGIPPLLAGLAGAALALRIVLDEETDVDARMRGALRRDAFDPDGLPRPGAVEPWAASRIAAVADAQRGNVTCYSGFSPFIGYGRRESEWALALPLLPSDPPGGTGPELPRSVAGFDAWDVVERLRHRLQEAADGAPPATGPAVRAQRSGPVRRAQAPGDGARLTGLVVEDRIFVSGRELAQEPPLLPDPLLAPATRLSADDLRRIALHPDGVARHCLASHVPLWGGEVVPSHFLHVAVVGRTLHLRCEKFVLGPVRRELHSVDLLPPADPRTGRSPSLALTALRRTGGALWAAPWSCLSDALAEYRRPRRLRRELRAALEDPAFDRGARVSVREDAQGPEYFHHFQSGDARRALHALDRHVLAAVRDFLDEHGVDTADFRAQTQTILNHGVLQTGGVSVVGNQAVGPGARATAESATAAAGAPPAQATGSGPVR